MVHSPSPSSQRERTLTKIAWFFLCVLSTLSLKYRLFSTNCVLVWYYLIFKKKILLIIISSVYCNNYRFFYSDSVVELATWDRQFPSWSLTVDTFAHEQHTLSSAEYWFFPGNTVTLRWLQNCLLGHKASNQTKLDIHFQEQINPVQIEQSTLYWDIATLSVICPNKNEQLKTNLISRQYLCFGYSKEPSHWEDSFEHPK